MSGMYPSNERGLPDAPTRGFAPPDESSGQSIGRYKILRKIGEGGCGIVYRAEQVEPVRRQVALKIIKLGMDTKEVIARFEAERQALALMDHPNIAKVIDAGATEQGRPFFVMELVRGVPITTYCDEQKLPIAARLELFSQVCRAVQHAHQKGIIHRDLKPSNILVALHGDVPSVKVIDFGIAKATQGRLTDATLFTAVDQFIGTPAYVSPEQANPGATDIDTRSDIYSLGVLLYELLTGHTPFDPKALARAGIDEMRRQICEVEPPRPSVRLATVNGGSTASPAQDRRAARSRRTGSISGDLDWIAMRCLEKDRTRRYATAGDIAEDLQRFLRHEPVSARPPGTWYVLRKLARRHRVATFWGAALAAALLVGASLIIWQAIAEVRARQWWTDQVVGAPRWESNADAVLDLFREELEGWLAPGGAPARDVSFQAVLDRAATRVAAHAARQPARGVALYDVLADAYSKNRLTREHLVTSARYSVRALELSRKNWGDDDDRTINIAFDVVFRAAELGYLELAESAETLIAEEKRRHPDDHRFNSGMSDRAPDSGVRGQKMRWKSYEIRLRILGAAHPETRGMFFRYVDFLRNSGRLVEAERLLAAEAATNRPFPFRAGSSHYRDVLSRLHRIYGEQGRRSEQIAVLAESVRSKLRASDRDSAADDLERLAVVLAQSRRTAEAETKLLDAVKVRTAEHGANYPTTIATQALLAAVRGNGADSARLERAATAAYKPNSTVDEMLSISRRLENHATFYRELGQPECNVAACAAVVELYTNSFGVRHIYTCEAMTRLAAATGLLTAKLAPAEQMHLQALALIREAPYYESHQSSTVRFMGPLRDWYQLQHKFDEAEKIARQMVEAKKTADQFAALASVLHDQGRLVEALELQEQTLRVRLEECGPDDRRTLVAKINLAETYAKLGRLDDAEKLAREGWQGWSRLSGEFHRGTFLAADNLAWIQARLGRTVEAEILASQTLEALQRIWGKQDVVAHMMRETLAAIREMSGKLADAERLRREVVSVRRAQRPTWPIKLGHSLLDLGKNLLQQEKFGEAEPVLRECVTLLGEETPDEWKTFEAQSCLGASLLGQKKFAEAEPLLLAGQEGMAARAAFIPPLFESAPRAAFGRLVALYSQSNQPLKLAAWQRKQEQYERARGTR